MRRKLLILNLTLAALAAALGWRLRENWESARAREAAVLRQKTGSLPPPPVTPLAAPQPVLPAHYNEIAQQMLFSKDRNPNVVVEVAPPPPPKPMPPLPIFYGVMNLGDGPTLLLAEKSGSQPREFKGGEMVGDFKLVSFSPEEVVLEWDGKTISKRAGELTEKEARAESRAAPTPVSAPVAPPVVQGSKGPGVDVGRGIKACTVGDTSPPGAVVDGYRKIVTDSPFGQVCRWEPVQ